ncbi:MbtH domain protein [Catenulispora acidiphila DSM 44928]|uniref:MbtH domain protein n=1 Tax=Catenulispora acidiphila (strain DSM 44928 / JCM 14897 / NBRC 102108 / NRRL B-24433 / ID139908) TaxID=479433 RepID=C7PZH9_CATAD|nr:MbtH family protein [Catenulispora acidiphila]ACU71636.1 MbtH domain protein [Catenulispora acidiphila DSM 44928]
MNVLDDEAAPFLVLGNAAQEYSLWPAAGDVPVPGGWRAVFGPAERHACLAEIGRVWVDRAGAESAGGESSGTGSAGGESAGTESTGTESARAQSTAATGSGGPR